MKRLGITGVPGAGKTSLARILAAKCRGLDRFKHVELVSEYARRYILKYGVIDHVSDQYKIMEKQIEWEDAVDNGSTDLMITDSPVHMGFTYALELQREDNKKDTMWINDIFKRMNKINSVRRYDIIIHLPPLITPVNDGVRADIQFTESWRKDKDFEIRSVLNLFKPEQLLILNGETNIDLRVNKCLEWINDLL